MTLINKSDDTQLIKGIIEGCIMAVISEKETYGYEILSVLSDNGFRNIQEGTLYPILTRLEKRKMITCRRAKSPYGPVRKYYSITDEGLQWLIGFKEEYLNITNNTQKILFGGGQIC